MKKITVLLLVLLIAAVASAAVKKKRFDINESNNVPVVDTLVVSSDTTLKKASENNPTVSVTNDGKYTQKKEFSFYGTIASAQKHLREKLTVAITAMKNGNWGAIWKFLLICLIYGMLHALGPGHGKSIVVGYFIARRGRWRQGVALGAGITITHTMSAVLLLLVLYAVFKATVFNAFETGRIGIERTSYALVMFTGILLVVLGIRDFIRQHRYSKGIANTNSAGLQNEPLQPIARWREIIGVAAITGIVPCPAVALIVLFCLLNSMVTLSLLGALFICIGMTITNVLFGVTAVALRKGIDKGSTHTRFASNVYTVASLAGGIIIFVSGLLLFSNQFAGRI
ncbi:MAG: hypothetical protein IKC23_05160 [Fibrobacter sp.]|nr:hypothetical protein [Fibrobacter sp.]